MQNSLKGAHENITAWILEYLHQFEQIIINLVINL